MITSPVYCTRGAVKTALGWQRTARVDDRIDRAIMAAVGDVDGRLHRSFTPTRATKHFPWPDRLRTRPWRVWLNQHDLISLTSLTAGDTSIDTSNVFLEPGNSGPPFTHLEIDLSTTASLSNDGTHQRAIKVEGLFGYRDNQTDAGTLDGGINASTTTVDVSDGSVVDVGHLLTVDDERMLVSNRRMADTGHTLAADLDAQVNAVTATLSQADAVEPGEVLLVDSERMQVVDVAGTTVTVRRAWDGSTLAAHTSGTAVHAERRLTVARGAAGTTAASHADATAVTRLVVPALVQELAIGEAIVRLEQAGAAYARTVGSGDNEREAAGRGLRDLRHEAYVAHGRMARKRAV